VIFAIDGWSNEREEVVTPVISTGITEEGAKMEEKRGERTVYMGGWVGERGM